MEAMPGLPRPPVLSLLDISPIKSMIGLVQSFYAFIEFGE